MNAGMRPSRTRLIPRAVLATACLAVFVASGGATEYRTSRDANLARQVLSALPDDTTFRARLVRAALERTFHVVRYEPAYVEISYPLGDVPAGTGVCTDEVIRAYRAVGVDLQALVHEDMARHFDAYPTQWGLHGPDRNIDHRRVPNLQAFLKRQGAALPVTNQAKDYLPGDLITCLVAQDLPHIAIVVPSPDGRGSPWIVHNIGEGPRYEDRLFEFPITGHYRWHPVSRLP